MKKSFFLFVTLLWSGFALAQCTFIKNETDKQTGNITKLVRSGNLASIPAGDYSGSMGFTVTETESKYVFLLHFKSGSSDGSERCITKEETKIAFTLQNGEKLETGAELRIKSCSDYRLDFTFVFSPEQAAQLKRSPVSVVSIYYADKIRDDITLTADKVNYFIDAFKCLDE